MPSARPSRRRIHSFGPTSHRLHGNGPGQGLLRGFLGGYYWDPEGKHSELAVKARIAARDREWSPPRIAWRSLLLADWLLFGLVYICFLAQLERWSATVRDRIFVNLLVVA
ncbi:hypothetical protein FGK60_10985 [Streptomyces sp. DASNCL29]|nr:hypothetical protein FGK60_10985 [Streptomyces sp. DASNCL29]